MSAKKIEEIKKQIEVTPEVKVEVKPDFKNDSSKAERAVLDKAILDASDSEKIRKDVMIMSIKELERHREILNKSIADITNDHETKRRILDGVNGSIAGAQSELYNLKNSFDRQNKVLIDELVKGRLEVEATDKTLRNLMRENLEVKKSNEIESSRLREYRNICDSQLSEMKKALDQNQSEWNKREADILRREDELKLAKEVLEDEKSSIAPELAKISEVKNENILLLQKIEMNRVDIENLRKSIISERERFEQEKLVNQGRIKQAEDRIVNEEARLRKWEQDIKDYDLEVRAKSAEADKVLRRQQLQREVESSKK